MKSLWGVISLFLVSSLALADNVPLAGPSAAQREEVLRHNAAVSTSRPSAAPEFDVLRPYAEFEEAKYFLITNDFTYDSREAKLGMVKNLPDSVIAVIMVSSQSAVESTKQTFSQVIPLERLRLVVVPGGGGFWARDSLPISVYVKGGQGGIGFIDARYYHGNEPDKTLGRFFNVPVMSHDYNYEGGNFAADREGNCIAVDDRIKNMTDEFFQKYYGCKTLTRLPWKGGIGHVDERAKFLSEKLVITDEKLYVPLFEKAGYNVKLLPKAQRPYETYVNSLLVNGTLYMPTFNQATDSEAKKVYEDLGYKVFAYSSSSLSNQGHGSLHCITMTYPKMAWTNLLSLIGAK